MELNSQTSFIPKKSLNDVKIRGNGIGFLSLIAFMIFLASIAFTAGVLVYKIAVQKDIASQKKYLADTNKTLDKNFINTVVRFNTRIETAKLLLNNHVALTPIFNFLEQYTVSSITFTSFNVKQNADNFIHIEMAGYSRGPDYDSIAQQSDEFGRRDFFKDVIFADLNPTLEGDVRFVFKAKLDPKLILFEDALKAEIKSAGSTKEETPKPSI